MGQYCCFPSTGYIVGRQSAAGPGAASGVGYGYGSRPAPIPVGAKSQVMVASNMGPTATINPGMASQIPITNVPSTDIYIPTYGQNSVMNVPSVVQPYQGNSIAHVQPYGVAPSYGQY